MVNSRKLVKWMAMLVLGVWELGVPAFAAKAAKDLDGSRLVTKIAFGSCAREDKPQPVWDAIVREQPDLMVMLGDNIYGDTFDMNVLRAKYARLGAQPGFRLLRDAIPVVATWDDHDYGRNDAGADYSKKNESRAIMLDFFAEPADSLRRSQDGGIYVDYLLGPAGKRVHLILLDTRWNRTPLTVVEAEEILEERFARNMGPYLPDSASDASLLGAKQWEWLEQRLEVEAEVTIIASSIQVLTDFTGWEGWGNFPNERERLLSMIKRHGQRSKMIFLISGDSHYAEFSSRSGVLPYVLWDLTSSGLTEEWRAIPPNRNRVDTAQPIANFGLIEIDRSGSSPAVTLSIKDTVGRPLLQRVVSANSIDRPAKIQRTKQKTKTKSG